MGKWDIKGYLSDMDLEDILKEELYYQTSYDWNSCHIIRDYGSKATLYVNNESSFKGHDSFDFIFDSNNHLIRIEGHSTNSGPAGIIWEKD